MAEQQAVGRAARVKQQLRQRRRQWRSGRGQLDSHVGALALAGVRWEWKLVAELLLALGAPASARPRPELSPSRAVAQVVLAPKSCRRTLPSIENSTTMPHPWAA